MQGAIEGANEAVYFTLKGVGLGLFIVAEILSILVIGYFTYKLAEKLFGETSLIALILAIISVLITGYSWLVLIHYLWSTH